MNEPVSSRTGAVRSHTGTTSIRIDSESTTAGPGSQLSWVETLPACFGTPTSRGGTPSTGIPLAETALVETSPAAGSSGRAARFDLLGNNVVEHDLSGGTSENRWDETPLAERYRSADPIEWQGTPVYPMYVEQLPGTTAKLTMVLLSAAPATDLRGFGMGLSTIDGYIGFGHRYLTGVDVWQDALERGTTLELTATTRDALFTLTPVWMVEDGRPCSWTGNYGIVVERSEPGRTVLWCSMGEGPPNFTDLVVEVRTVATAAQTMAQSPAIAFPVDADDTPGPGFEHRGARGPIPVISVPPDRRAAAEPDSTADAHIESPVADTRLGVSDDLDDCLAITTPLDYDPRELDARPLGLDTARLVDRAPHHRIDGAYRSGGAVRHDNGEDPHHDTSPFSDGAPDRDESTDPPITDEARNTPTGFESISASTSAAPAPTEPTPMPDSDQDEDPSQASPTVGARQPADPAYRRALYGLGVAMYGLGDDERARMLWSRAASVGHAGAAYDLGVLHIRRGEPAEAEHWWRIASNRRVVRAMTDLAELLEHRGKYGEARLWRTQAAAEHAIAAGIRRRNPALSDAMNSTGVRADHQRLPAVGGTAARKM